MSEVASLWASLGLDTAKFQEGIAKASASMTAFEKSVKPIARGFKNFGKDLDKLGSSLTSNLTTPILAAGAAITATVYATSKFGGEINDMSVRTGFSREALQELKFAADQTGVSMESIEGATRKLTKSMGDAALGEGKAAGLFKQLGIEVKNADGSLRPANIVFGETLDALRRIPDETTRNVVGMELLGKSAGDLNPLIAEGKEGLNKFAKEARDAGLVMSEDAVMAADEFGDKMDKLKAQFGHASMELGTAFMPLIEQFAGVIEANVIPAIKKFAEWFGSLSDTQKKWIAIGAAVLAGLGPMIIAIGGVVSALGTIISIAPAVAAAWGAILWPITLVLAGLAIIAAEWYAAITLIKSTAGSIEGFWNWVKGIFENLIRYAKAVGTTLKGLFTFDMSTIQKGIDDFNNALDIGSKNTLEHQRNIKGLVDKYNAQAEASKAAEASTRAHIAEMRKGKPVVDALNVSLNKQKEILEVFPDGFDKFTADQKAATEANRAALAPIQAWADANKNAAVEVEAMGGISAETFTRLGTSIPEGIAPAQQAILDFTGLVQQAMESTAVAVGEAVGAMISGTGKIGGILSAVMTGIADFVGNFGKAMIAASTAAMLAKASLATPASLAAGVALVGLSVVLKNVIASKPMGFAEGGLVFGETMGLIGEGRGTTRSNPEVVAPLDKLMGFMPQGGEGMGGKVEFIIQGETLRAVLDKNNKSNRFLGNKG